jgi:hypothetical protein
MQSEVRGEAGTPLLTLRLPARVLLVLQSTPGQGVCHPFCKVILRHADMPNLAFGRYHNINSEHFTS